MRRKKSLSWLDSSKEDALLTLMNEVWQCALPKCLVIRTMWAMKGISTGGAGGLFFLLLEEKPFGTINMSASNLAIAKDAKASCLHKAKLHQSIGSVMHFLVQLASLT